MQKIQTAVLTVSDVGGGADKTPESSAIAACKTLKDAMAALHKMHPAGSVSTHDCLCNQL